VCGRARRVRQSLNARSVAIFGIPAGSDFERYRDVDSANHGLQYLCDQALVFEKRRACELLADLFRRATHINVDDLGTQIDVKLRCFGQHLRVCASNLSGYRTWLTGVIGFTHTRLRSVELAVGGNHLRHSKTGPESSTQLSERSIGHTSHWRHDQVVLKLVGTDVH